MKLGSLGPQPLSAALYSSPEKPCCPLPLRAFLCARRTLHVPGRVKGQLFFRDLSCKKGENFAFQGMRRCVVGGLRKEKRRSILGNPQSRQTQMVDALAQTATFHPFLPLLTITELLPHPKSQPVITGDLGRFLPQAPGCLLCCAAHSHPICRCPLSSVAPG